MIYLVSLKLYKLLGVFILKSNFLFFCLANILCPMQICSICGKNHLDANCKVNPSKLKCSICNINGHSDEMCTNNWKLYHNVTDLKDLNHIKPPNLNSNNMICITCGSSQHWTFVS